MSLRYFRPPPLPFAPVEAVSLADYARAQQRHTSRISTRRHGLKRITQQAVSSCLCVELPGLKLREAEGAVEVAVEFVEVADVLLQHAWEVADLLHLNDEVGAREEGRVRVA